MSFLHIRCIILDWMRKFAMMSSVGQVDCNQTSPEKIHWSHFLSPKGHQNEASKCYRKTQFGKRQLSKLTSCPDFTSPFGHDSSSLTRNRFLIHLYPSAIFEVFFWWWNPKFAETPRNSTERLCRIPPTDQPSFKPFTKRIRDVDRAKLVESKPQSCAKVVGCGVTLKRCQQCRWSHSDVHG